MDSEKLNDWLQILGAAGIIASLVFVGMQLKQSQDIAIAAQYQARHDAAAENIRIYLQSETTLKFMGKEIVSAALSDPNIPAEVKESILALPPENVAVGVFQAHLDLLTFDNLYFQYQAGFLSDEGWQAMREQARLLLAQDMPKSRLRRLYEHDPSRYRKSFREFFDGLIREVDSNAQRPDP